MSTSTTISPETTVGKIAVDYPLATRVFARHGMDFCCGGGKPINEVCEKLGLETQSILQEIEKEIQSTSTTMKRWDEAPLSELIEHILETYHQPLREELPRLEAMARRVLHVHGEKDPERLAQLVEVLASLRTELEQHMMKEEQILFPMILQGQGVSAQGPVSVMLHEHDDAGQALRTLNELTDGYQVPAEACNTWRALWFGLAALESELHVHIHLENNILFPRAIANN